MAGPAGAVELRRISKFFGSVQAVKSVDLTLDAGSFTTLLGPSGCGKTTILRMVAGLETPSDGEILVNGNRINEVPIHKRNIGLVFQNYALFPHKSVFDNVAFGLKYRDVPKDESRRRVAQALELVRLPGMESRLPSQLSGGQQQRIALARAVVIQPDVLLLDEPLSALDANLREEMRVELKKIQRELNITTLFVTHDQEEALAMSDTVVVMSEGESEQQGAPEEVYNRPASAFVADFLGYSNLLEARVLGSNGATTTLELADGVTVNADNENGHFGHARVKLVIRAEKVGIASDWNSANGDSILDGTVADVDYLGVTARYFVTVGDLRLQVIGTIDERPFREGESVKLRIRPRDCVVLGSA